MPEYNYIELYNFQEISIECFEKCKTNKKLLPLASQKNYQLLFYETSPPRIKPNFERSPTLMQRRNTNTSPSSSNLRSIAVPTSTQSQVILDPKVVSPKTAVDFQQHRTNLLTTISPSVYKSATSHGLLNRHATEYSKFRMSTASFGASRYRTPTSLTSLELKPATVEGKLTSLKYTGI